MSEIWFYDLFEARQPENLATLLVGRYGYCDHNPGPVVAFPPNAVWYKDGVPARLAPGMRIAISWNPARLKQQIDIEQQYIAGVTRAAERAVQRLSQDRKKVQRVAMTIDAVAAVATMWEDCRDGKAVVDAVLSLPRADERGHIQTAAAGQAVASGRVNGVRYLTVLRQD
jgi:hypothetical protein